ncbi:MAG: hypothetical protein ACFFCP_02160 [Promethearchaeota archaeon]
MNKVKATPSLSEDEWTSSPEDVTSELQSFIKEFGSFTPELFVQIKFHLLKNSGLTKQTRDELCGLSIHHGFCSGCDALYEAKNCLLWYRLFKIIQWENVKRAPPCIRLAYAKKSIKTVTIYMTKANLIDAPFYKARGSTSCNTMRRWGYCHPNEYCRAMATDNTLEYTTARERVKQSRKL